MPLQVIAAEVSAAWRNAMPSVVLCILSSSGTARKADSCRRTYALPQPEENAHVAGVRCPAPLVQPVGHLKQNPTQNMEMLSGIGSGVIIIVIVIFIVWLFPDFQIAIYMQAQALRTTDKGLKFEQ